MDFGNKIKCFVGNFTEHLYLIPYLWDEAFLNTLRWATCKKVLKSLKPFGMWNIYLGVFVQQLIYASTR